MSDKQGLLEQNRATPEEEQQLKNVANLVMAMLHSPKTRKLYMNMLANAEKPEAGIGMVMAAIIRKLKAKAKQDIFPAVLNQLLKLLLSELVNLAVKRGIVPKEQVNATFMAHCMQQYVAFMARDMKQPQKVNESAMHQQHEQIMQQAGMAKMPDPVRNEIAQAIHGGTANG